MISPRTYEQKLADDAKIHEIEQHTPELTEAEDAAQFTEPYHHKIGIQLPDAPLGHGFLKLHYRDFIVEEITLDKRVISISPTSDTPSPNTQAGTPKVQATLVKQGLATFDALELLAHALSLPLENIRQAGLKDARAITAQEITVTDVTPEQLAAVEIPNTFFKDIRTTADVLSPGQLLGNRFTILVRTEPTIDASALRERALHIRDHGFLNFFSLQRFGARLNAHSLGRLILQQKYETALKLFLCGQSSHEMRLLQGYRKQASELWGNWGEMRQIFDAFPYFCYNERLALDYLEHNPTDFVGALAAIKSQTSIWVQAYFSYCLNKLLSQLAQANTLPAELPLLRLNEKTELLYADVISTEEIKSIRYKHPRLPFLQLREQSIPTHVYPTIHSIVPCDAGYIFHFDLDKGAYATTFLSQIFGLSQGRHAPSWVDQEIIDTRALLNYPPLTQTEEAFPKGEMLTNEFE